LAGDFDRYRFPADFQPHVEYVAHYTQETYFSAVLPASEIIRAHCLRRFGLFSVMSAMFNLFIMRHGVLLVGAGAERSRVGAI
jgi:hypothetical protein